MTRPSILITGGTGLLGLHWAAACRDTHAVSVSLHKRRTALSGTTARSLDLADPHALDVALTEGRISCVIHAAGLTSVESCEQNPDAAHYYNVTIAANVAAATARTGAALIHVSTDHLFDGRADLYDEDSQVSPVNVYGRSKALAEEAVLRAQPGALILRTNFYGWGPSYRPSFSDWILASLRQDRPLRLFTDMRYTPTHITPLIAAAMELSAKGTAGIVNVVGDEALSKYCFGLRLAECFGLSTCKIEPAQLADQTDLVRRPLSMALSTLRLQTLLGRSLGGISRHLDLLRSQEKMHAITEIRNL